MILVFTTINDERVEVKLNGEHIIEMNHDDHGWDGMGAIRTALTKVAAIAGWRIAERDENG